MCTTLDTQPVDKTQGRMKKLTFMNWVQENERRAENWTSLFGTKNTSGRYHCYFKQSFCDNKNRVRLTFPGNIWFSLNPPKRDGLTVRNIGKTNSLVVFSLLFFHYSLISEYVWKNFSSWNIYSSAHLSKACIFIGPLYVAALLFLRLVLCFFCLFYCLADQSWKTLRQLLHHPTFTVRLIKVIKPWTPKIFLECSLCRNQSDARSNNKKKLETTTCVSFFSSLIGLLPQHNNIPEMILVFMFSGAFDWEIWIWILKSGYRISQ